MNYLDLFSGIGGFSLGLDRAGMNCVGQVEIDPFCNKVLEKHWPHVKRVKDIHDVKGNEFGTAELVCGGFPCQPFSVAGKQKGKEDDRYLWPEMFRVIQKVGPAWVIGENVSGFVNMGLKDCVSDLESIGYEVQPIIIPACGVDAPHQRYRVWVLAYSRHNDRLNTEVSRNNDKGVADNTERKSPTLKPSGPGCGQRGVEILANTKEKLCDRRMQTRRWGPGFTNSGWWPPESGVARMVTGLPKRVDRCRALGNAVVPQVVQLIGEMIKESGLI